MTRASRAACLFLASALAALALDACKSTPSAPPDAPAGSVVSVEGRVTAKRAAAPKPRTIAVDAAVYADDTVTTGSNGSVQIRLEHNRALWSLGAGQSRRVDSSLAWAAPAESGGDVLFKRTDGKDETHAAGRHGEHEGVSSGEAAIRGDDATSAGNVKKEVTGRPVGLDTKESEDDARLDAERRKLEEMNRQLDAEKQQLEQSQRQQEEQKASNEAEREAAMKALLGSQHDGDDGTFHDLVDQGGTGGGGSGLNGTGGGGGGGGSSHVGLDSIPIATPTVAKAHAHATATPRKVIHLEEIAVMGREAHQTLTVTEMVVSPSLDAKAIQGAIDDELSDQINRCFDARWGIEGGAERATVGIVLEVTTAGRASASSVRWSGDAAIRSCVERGLANWSIAPKGRAGRVQLEVEVVKVAPPPEQRPVEAK